MSPGVNKTVVDAQLGGFHNPSIGQQVLKFQYNDNNQPSNIEKSPVVKYFLDLIKIIIGISFTSTSNIMTSNDVVDNSHQAQTGISNDRQIMKKKIPVYGNQFQTVLEHRIVPYEIWLPVLGT